MDRLSKGTNSPDLNDVALFVQVVQAASFSAAARQNSVPVSTVSRRIARLEARLGARLLERTTRRLRLTETGRVYFEHAEHALDALEEGRDRVRALHTIPRGHIRITAPAGLASALMAALASYLIREVLVSVELDLSERRVDMLAEGFDIGIRAGTVDTPDLIGRTIERSEGCLYASRGYLNRRGRPSSLSELASHDLIAVARSSAYGAVWELSLGAASRHHFEFRPRLLVSELMAAKAAAVAGIGIVLLPAIVVREAELERVLPELAAEATNLWLLYPARRPLTAAVRSCIEHLSVRLNAHT